MLDKELEVRKVAGESNLADLLTKHLAEAKMEMFFLLTSDTHAHTSQASAVEQIHETSTSRAVH